MSDSSFWFFFLHRDLKKKKKDLFFFKCSHDVNEHISTLTDCCITAEVKENEADAGLVHPAQLSSYRCSHQQKLQAQS